MRSASRHRARGRRLRRRGPAVHPDADETCNSADDDCDGEVDEDGDTLLYVDADGDGYGSEETTLACPGSAGTSQVTGDCDDTSASNSPGHSETCDGVDNDCDGLTDLDDPDLPEGEIPTWYVDGDADKWAAQGAEAVEGCSDTPPEGYSVRLGDCDDADDEVYPSWGTADMDCDGTPGIRLAGAAGVWHGPRIGYSSGASVYSGDVTRDGVDDWIAGAFTDDARGAVAVLDGTGSWASGAHSLEDAEGLWLGDPGDGAEAWGASPVFADLDGDGAADWALAAPGAEEGAFMVFPSSSTGVLGSHSVAEAAISWSSWACCGLETPF